MKKVFRNFALTVALGLVTLPAAAANHKQHLSPLENQVRHELVTMPYYSFFDNLVFKVEGSKVTLSGQTIRPTIKSSAERLVARLEGVTIVENEIEVLPFSSYDDRLRLRLARAIYTNPVLDRLGLRSVPSIHIIVRNGDVTSSCWPFKKDSTSLRLMEPDRCTIASNLTVANQNFGKWPRTEK